MFIFNKHQDNKSFVTKPNITSNNNTNTQKKRQPYTIKLSIGFEKKFKQYRNKTWLKGNIQTKERAKQNLAALLDDKPKPQRKTTSTTTHKEK